MPTRITLDPVARVEGHLRIDCEVDDGRVTRAWVSGQMWRGIEPILVGRDPREAWLFTQRICGVCTTVHAIASVRAVENALGLEIPLNAQYIRNLILAAHAIHDHIVHFYHLAALDWVDIVAALRADPRQSARLAEGMSSWSHNGAEEMQATQERLKALAGSGQLGIFAGDFGGHPAMRLPPEVNLLAATHYLQALEVQRKANQIVAILGSKTPHIQNLAVGGVANPISLNPLTLERLFYVKELIDQLGDFVRNAFVADVAALGAYYAEWTGYGAGVTDYLALPDFPLDGAGTRFALPGGYIENGDLASFRPITSFQDPFFRDGVEESVKHAWYQGDAPLHPWQGKTEPRYSDFQHQGRYSWVKAPTFYGKPAQVGPLAHVLCMLAAGHAPTRRHLDRLLQSAAAIAGTEIPSTALHSTIGRFAARAVRCAVLHEILETQWQALMDNLDRGDVRTSVQPEFPAQEVRGLGFHEAPRGALSHWVVIEGGKIKNYQAVVPTTWNAAPRNDDDQPGPYEAALVGNPVVDPEAPLEVLRTVHSFDPCLACAVHMLDRDRGELVRVQAL